MSFNSDSAPAVLIYSPTPNPVLNVKLAFLAAYFGAMHNQIRRIYMNQLVQLDPLNPEYHSIVQMILFMQNHHTAWLKERCESAALLQYAEAGLYHSGV